MSLVKRLIRYFHNIAPEYAYGTDNLPRTGTRPHENAFLDVDLYWLSIRIRALLIRLSHFFENHLYVRQSDIDTLPHILARTSRATLAFLFLV